MEKESEDITEAAKSMKLDDDEDEEDEEEEACAER